MEDTENKTTENIGNIESTADKKTCDNDYSCKIRINLILNIVILAGLVVLYILYFMNKNSNSVNNATLQKSNSTVSVGYVNSDSIMSNYELVNYMKDSLESQTKKFESQFMAAQSSFETQVLDYQKKLKANQLSIEQATVTEKKLGKQQEALLAMKDELTSKLAAQELELNLVLHDSIISCLKRYNKKYNFDYILGFSKGGGILYANDSLNITNEILQQLNKEYRSKK